MRTFCGIGVSDDVFSFVEQEYAEFMKKKKVYMNERTNENYLELTFAYAGIDSDLKDLLSKELLSMSEFQSIRNELKKGL